MVVLGGGFAGLLAAYRCAVKGEKVAVVERSNEFGGLLRSLRYDGGSGQNYSFDIGTHYLLETGDQQIDQQLRLLLDADQWTWFEESLPEGHVAAGVLDPTTGCLNAASYGDELHRQITADFFAAPGNGDSQQTLKDELIADFGETAFKDVYAPIFKKFADLDPIEAAQGAFGIFAPYRIKLFEDKRGTQMKVAPFLDRRLAHSRREFGTSTIRKGYPKSCGVGLFIDGLVEQLRAHDVSLLAGCAVERMTVKNGSIDRLEMMSRGEQESETVSCGRVVTTLAPALNCRMLGLQLSGGPPKFRSLCTHHLVCDSRATVEDLHWITVFDPEFRSFRITLYDNVCEDQGRHGHRITVESLCNSVDDCPEREVVIDELARLGIVAAPADVKEVWQHLVPNALPVQRVGWQDQVASQVEEARAAADNLIPVGLAAAAGFGQINTIKSVFETLS